MGLPSGGQFRDRVSSRTRRRGDTHDLHPIASVTFRRRLTGRLAGRLTLAAFLTGAGLLPTPAAAQQRAATYDLILRGGTVVDGSGAPRYRADVAISRGYIARVGDLAGATATTELDVRGLFVAPGFINIHSHASPAALPTAENMLTQGVTTELLNADGGGPLDIGGQLDALQQAGLAVNVAASAGFNTVWTNVVGRSDRRPSPDEIEKMGAMIVANLERGAFGVSAGLDYKPAYFSTLDEAIRVLAPARRWRTFFTNHDRLTPESGFSSRKGMEETVEIGERAGLVPLFTHMKAQGRERGSAPAILEMMGRATAEGRWVTADVYPYLAGQTALAALIIPGWAQDGGIEKMRERFRDPAQRARIVRESNEAIAARLAGAESIVLNETGRKLADIMRERGLATPGEAVVAVLETEFPSAIMSFGAEEDLVRFMQDPEIAIACDCGATTDTRWHPRAYGTFPRVLGRYVRESRALTWEEAVRKMSGLPASITGLVDRGLIAPGMAADVAVFDTATVIDHATYERPTLLSEGIRVVLVNGVIALRDGKVTGERGGSAVRRTAHMPSRPQRLDAARSVKASGALAAGGGAARTLLVDVSQAKGARFATGRVRLSGGDGALESVSLGMLQAGDRWASVTGRARVGADERAFTLIVDAADPMTAGEPTTVVLQVEGMEPVRGTLPARATVRPAPAAKR